MYNNNNHDVWIECGNDHSAIRFKLTLDDGTLRDNKYVSVYDKENIPSVCPICKLYILIEDLKDLRELRDMHTWWKKTEAVNAALVEEG